LADRDAGAGGKRIEETSAVAPASFNDNANEPTNTLDRATRGEPDSSDSLTEAGGSAGALRPAAMFALLNRTKQKVEGWPAVATGEPAVKRQAAIELFDDLCSLGVQLGLSTDSGGAAGLMHDRAQDISRAIKRQPDLVEVLHNAAKAQLNGALPRSKNGWALVCTIGMTEELEGAWRVTVADSTLLPLKVPTIEIPKSVLPQVNSGQHLLLLGRFVRPEAAGDASPNPAAENSQRSAPEGELFRASFSYGM
jgi:hypothetical protein